MPRSSRGRGYLRESMEKQKSGFSRLSNRVGELEREVSSAITGMKSFQEQTHHQISSRKRSP